MKLIFEAYDSFGKWYNEWNITNPEEAKSIIDKFMKGNKLESGFLDCFKIDEEV